MSPSWGRRFIDVTGDGDVTALDALRIINALNRQTPLDIESSDLLGSRVRLTFPEVLADGDFEVFFAGNVTDLAGNFATALTKNTFKVADPPGIESISPANGERHVNVRREIIVKFDEPIDPATITAETFKVFAAGQAVPGTIRVNRTQQTATFFVTVCMIKQRPL